jgi:hypothetical protein
MPDDGLRQILAHEIRGDILVTHCLAKKRVVDVVDHLHGASTTSGTPRETTPPFAGKPRTGRVGKPWIK